GVEALCGQAEILQRIAVKRQAFIANTQSQREDRVVLHDQRRGTSEFFRRLGIPHTQEDRTIVHPNSSSDDRRCDIWLVSIEDQPIKRRAERSQVSLE